VLGNILAISDEDVVQVAIISAVSLFVLILKWKDLMVTFFDESHARSLGLNTTLLKVVFFTLLSACTVAAPHKASAIANKVMGLVARRNGARACERRAGFIRTILGKMEGGWGGNTIRSTGWPGARRQRPMWRLSCKASREVRMLLRNSVDGRAFVGILWHTLSGQAKFRTPEEVLSTHRAKTARIVLRRHKATK
jgi:hypothetical protein